MCDGCGGPPREGLTRRNFIERLPRAVAGGLAAATLLSWGRAETVDAATRKRDLLCKEAWGGDPAGAGLERHRVRRLTVHHSALKLTDNREAPGRFRAYQRDHRAEGWPDIAYHLLIDRHGNVYKGRPSWARGDTRTDYDPTGHLLVMCEGNMSEQDISIRQMAGLVDVLAWACVRFDVTPRTIRGHRAYAQTECPGSHLGQRIADGEVARRVKRRLERGGSDLVRLCGEAGRRLVRRIEAGAD